MDLLLDTHTLLWWVDDAPQLSAMARKAIMEADGFVYVSLASVWESAIKVSLRKLRLALPVKQYVPYHLAANGFIQLPIDFSHICQVETLPWHHRDPFDRLLIAQAQIQDLPLVSADARFDRYGIPRIW